MKFYLLVLAGIMTLSGCVSTKNIAISDESMEALSGQSIVLTKREVPAFSAATAGKAAFALVGAAAMISAGNKIIEENEVVDPANYIASSLADYLTESRGVVIETNTVGILSSEKVPEIAQQYEGVSYVLDVRTINWSFGYFPIDWNSYRVMYSVKLRLIETETASIVAEGFCYRVPEKTYDAPSKDALLADNAKRLKSELKIAADKCIDEFKNGIFTI